MTSSLPPADSPAAAPTPALRFGRCVLRPHTRELWRDGQPVEIQRLSLDLLRYLLAHPERDISKDELLREVWQDAEVTDSVVARAVMKLRRAIGDEAHPPTLLRTVHGVGYRWLAVPQAHAPGTVEHQPVAAAQATVAVLPVAWHGEPQFAWAQEGLPTLLGHLLGADGRVRLVEAAQLQQADLPHAPWPERAANVRAALGADWVIHARLSGQAHALSLHLHANPDKPDGPQQVLVSTTVPGLAEQAAAWLGQQLAAPARSAQALEGATLELLARSSHEAHHGHLARALALLREAQGLSPDSVLVSLELANVLRLTGELTQAEAAAEHSWTLIIAMPEDQRPAALALKVRVSQAKLAHARGELLRARHYMDLAAPLAKVVPGRQDRAEWAIFSGSLAHSMGELDLAQSELEAAVSLLAGSDNVLLQVRSRALLADVLGQRGLVTRAAELLQRAQQLLARINAEPTSASVQLYCAALNKRRRYFTLTLAQLEQVRAVYERVGHAYTVWYCRTTRVDVLTELGQLQRAEQEALELIEDAQPWRAKGALPLPDVDLLMPLRLAQIQWLRGEHTEGLKRSLTALAAAMRSEYLKGVVQSLQMRVLSQCISLGWHAQAAEVQADLRLDGDPLMQARLQAMLALASGQVDLSMQVLREAWNSGPSHAAMRMDAAIDLAWLALAQGRPQELESLMAHIDDECDEYLPAIVVRARYLDHQGLRQEALNELHRVMQMHAESALSLVHVAVLALQQGQPWPEARSLLTEAVRD